MQLGVCFDSKLTIPKTLQINQNPEKKMLEFSFISSIHTNVL